MLHSAWVGARGVNGSLHFTVPSMLEQIQSNRFCIYLFYSIYFQHFQFCRAGFSLGIIISLYFIATSALFVPCGGCKMSPRTFDQGCYISDP
jgi:hypothetical protein